MADNEESTRGPLPPYGPAIWDAAKRGDIQEMEHVADAARHALARGGQQEGVVTGGAPESVVSHFRDVAAHEVVAVREALTHLEQKIAEMRHRPHSGGESPKPPQQ